jgi:hypothetical protein
VTLLVAGTTVLAYGRAADAADHAGTLTAGDAYGDAVDDAKRKRTILYANYAAGVLAAATTGYLWWRATRTPERGVTVGPAVSSDGAGVWLIGSF